MCFSESSNLSDEERSALYFISGYVAFKEKLGVCVPEKLTANSEFLQLVSRGKLSHPPQKLFDLSLLLLLFQREE